MDSSKTPRKANRRDLRLPLLRSLDRLNDDDEFHEWMTLSEAADFLVDAANYETSSELVKTYIDEIAAMLEQLASEGVVQKENETASVFSTRFRLRELDAVAREEERALNFSEVGRLPVTSASWTGLPRTGVLSEPAVEKLLEALRVVEDAVEKSSASNEVISQARAYVIAIHALASAPEPPADLIWTLISRAADIATIGAFFVTVIALFASTNA